MVSRLLQSETQANCNKKKLFCDMIAEKKTKHYINNKKLIEKTSLSCFLNQFVFLGLRIKKKKTCWSVMELVRAWKIFKEMAVVILFTYEMKQLQMLLL